MMAIMTDGNKEELPKEFIEGGRTGRRNAMPDILHSDANVTTADLPERLQQLATSEVQSSSTPCSVAESSSSCNSDNILMTFLESDRAGRRHAIGKVPCLYSSNQATAVSESSWKYCCSQECLDQFLKSHLSKRREAKACIKIPGPNASTSVHSNDFPITRPRVEYIRHIPNMDVPARATQVIQINEDMLSEMLNDPSNPQPGPSAGSTPPEEDNKEKQEGS